MKIPGPFELSAAWSGLPDSLRDHIGFIAFDMVFQGFLSGQAHAPEDRVLASDEERGEAYDCECRRMTELYRTVEGAAPDIFGPEGENPAWAPTNAGARAVHEDEPSQGRLREVV